MVPGHRGRGLFDLSIVGTPPLPPSPALGRVQSVHCPVTAAYNLCRPGARSRYTGPLLSSSCHCSLALTLEITLHREQTSWEAL